ncbi:8577_t:CDS:2 [Funneliformis geosporum]|nr:8577_t:CDS:2 [Funneliformis geosporum]
MPKTIKQKNYNRVINSNIDSKFDRETNNGDDNYNYVLKPTFPSRLSMNEIIGVIKSPSNNKKAKTFPNAFIAYKIALIKENRIRNIKLPPMGQLSKIASCYWNKESENVKEVYRKLSEDAKSLKHTILTTEFGYANNTQTKEVEDIVHATNSSSGYLTNKDSTVGAMTTVRLAFFRLEIVPISRS